MMESQVCRNPIGGKLICCCVCKTAVMRSFRWQEAVPASLVVLLLPFLAPSSAFVTHPGPAAARTTLQQSVGKAVSPPSTCRAHPRSGTGARRASSRAAKISMSFDLGEMMEQLKNSMGGGGSGGGGGGANGKRDIVYDAAIVGYGPAGGVMVSLAVGGC